MKHTPEPWIAAELGVISNTLTSHGNFYICSLIDPENEEDKANARRIVACVNACEGIPTEWLEKEKLTVVQIRDLEAQNARLLEALKGIVEYVEELPGDGGFETRMRKAKETAHAAIAEAEATKPDSHTKATIL